MQDAADDVNENLQHDADAATGEPGTAQAVPIVSNAVPLRADGKISEPEHAGNTIQPPVSDEQADEYESAGANPTHPINPARIARNAADDEDIEEAEETDENGGQKSARVSREAALAYIELTGFSEKRESSVTEGDSYASARLENGVVRLTWVRGKTRYDSAQLERDTAETRRGLIRAQVPWHEKQIADIAADLEAYPDEIAAERSDEAAYEIAKVSAAQRTIRHQAEIDRLNAEAEGVEDNVPDAPKPEGGELVLTYPHATLVLV